MTVHDTSFVGVKIEMDFRSDWTSILKKRIQVSGYNVESTWDDSTISDVYFNLVRRLIEPKPRKVVQSREFKCPPEFVRGLEWIKDKAIRGGDLNPHLSRKIKDTLYNDPLLNDWDIQHLHLGEKIESNGFATGTGPVLFARVTSDTFYLLDVLPHGSWTRKRLIEIIHLNWPLSIAECRVHYVIDIEHNPNEQEIGELRNGNVNTMLKMNDGTIYLPLGLGVTTSGVAVEVVENSHRFFRLVDTIERHVKEHASELVDMAKESDHARGKTLHFGLVDIQDDFVEIVELNNGSGAPIRIPLAPPG